MIQKKQTALSAIARIGFIGKGVVYFMVGLLALQTAIGIGRQQSSTKQALQEIIGQPLGSILLVGCIIGLFAHAIWRLILSLWDPDNRGKGVRTLLFRGVDFIVGFLYLSLSYAAWQILRGLNTTSSSQSTEVWIGKILALPFGKWFVITAALVVLIIGLYQFYLAYMGNFDYRFDTSNMNTGEQRTMQIMGRIGFSAWGIVYLMISILFYEAAVNYNPDQAGGLSDALFALKQQPHGIWILGITATGLLIYGMYLFILSYYYELYK